jgi:hypothetical protein
MHMVLYSVFCMCMSVHAQNISMMMPYKAITGIPLERESEWLGIECKGDFTCLPLEFLPTE